MLLYCESAFTGKDFCFCCLLLFVEHHRKIELGDKFGEFSIHFGNLGENIEIPDQSIFEGL